MTDFTGKTVLITGGAGQIGKATAKAFLNAGASVALVDLSEDMLEDAAQQLGCHDRLLLLAADVSDEAAVAEYVCRTEAHFGHIDIFFNNAGITGARQELVDMDMDHWQKLMDVNLRGVTLGLKYVLRVMYQQGYGSVINTASQTGQRAQIGGGDYCVSKAAILHLTRVAALEAGPHGVRVNAIMPGIVHSDMILENNKKQGISEEQFGKMLAQIVPLGRWADLEEIANTVLFLASDAASYITGCDLKVDGGSLCKS